MDLEGLSPSPMSHRRRPPHKEGQDPRNVESYCKSQGLNLAGPYSSCATLSELCHLPMPQFPHLQHRDGNPGFRFIASSQMLKKTMSRKFSEEFPV